MNGSPERMPFFYAPDGRLVQVELAREVVNKGSTTIGLKTKDFVLLSSHVKSTLPLLEPPEKVYPVDDHIGATGSGNIADVLTLVDMLRLEAQRHRLTYGSDVDATTLARYIGSYMHGFTLYTVRPVGASLVLAGKDDLGLQLLVVDPSGTVARGQAAVIGYNNATARNVLQDGYRNDLNLQEAMDLVTRATEAAVEGTPAMEFGVIRDGNGKFTKLPSPVAG